MEEPQDTLEEPTGQEPTPEGGDLEPAPTVLEGGPGLEQEPAPEFKPKHQSWEETEKARTTLEKDFHTAKGQVSQLTKELETLKKVHEKMGVQKEEPKVDTPRSRMIDAVNNKIRQYDQQLEAGKINNEQHSRLVLEAWAEGNEKLADARVDARLTEHDQRSSQIATAENRLKKSGLSLMVTDETTGEEVDLMNRAFWLLAHDPGIPKGVSIEEEADWIIDQLKIFENAIIERFKADQTGVKTDTPLRKGVKTPKLEEEVEGLGSIGEDLKFAKEQRRIK